MMIRDGFLFLAAFGAKFCAGRAEEVTTAQAKAGSFHLTRIDHRNRTRLATLGGEM